MSTEHTKHPCETVDASADVMKLAGMILSDCGCSTAISDRLQRRVAGRIQLYVDGLLGGQKTEPVEQGLYTILYRDNWDGEGDTSYLLARLDPNGEWYAEESGAQLMTYEGDAILRAWPIAEDTAMRPEPQPVLNCWCCSTLVTFKQRADADGNCPHCGAELDVDKDLVAQQQAEPVAPTVKESLTADRQAELATLCASCARADVNCPIYPQQTASCVEHRTAAEQAQQAEPVAVVKIGNHAPLELGSYMRVEGTPSGALKVTCTREHAPAVAVAVAMPDTTITNLAVEHFQMDYDRLPGSVFTFARAVLAAAQKGGEA